MPTVLYPRCCRYEVIGPLEINEYGQVMWKLTNWDIKYIECMQISEHFHLDHKNYYTNYMRNYQLGISRDEFISDLDFFY